MQQIIEKKILLNGDIREFKCSLIHRGDGFGILRYIVDKPHNVSGLILPVKTVTCGFYWTDRPYTLYRWYYGGQNIGNYFNIADFVEITNTEFVWRDLVLDILCQPGKNPMILDEDELPPDIREELLEYINSSVRLILEDYEKIIVETEAMIPSRDILREE